MKSSEFIKRLGDALETLPEEERMSALSYYEEYFSEAADEERAVIKLGLPETVAQNIINDYYAQNGQNARGAKTKTQNRLSDTGRILLVAVLVLLSPVILPLLAAAVGLAIGAVCLVLGLFVAVAACLIGLLVGGYAVAAVGAALSLFSILVFLSMPLADGLFILGTGLVLAALGLAFGILFTWMTIKVLPGLISWFVDLCRLPFKRRKKAA